VLRKPRANGAHVQPLSLLAAVGFMFLVVGVLSYPAFLVVGVVFVMIGIRGFQEHKTADTDGKPPG
jgi:hypothetical protein